MGLSDKAIAKAKELVCESIDAYSQKIKDAYDNTDTDETAEVKIKLSVNIVDNGDGTEEVEAAISFVLEKISDKFTVRVDPNQPSLFDIDDGSMVDENTGEVMD